MENILDWIDADDLFLIKYGLICANFITIAFILIYKAKNPKQLQTPQNVLLVTAHPDDEAMFFLPTIQTLKSQNYKIHLLCLSNGGFDGLGKIREKELDDCCKALKIDHLQIVDDPNLQDGMRNDWPIEKMKSIIQEYVNQNDIKGIITFDDYGVSGHPNHIAISKACLQVNCKKILTLESTNIVRKYISFFDFFISTFYSENLTVQLNPILAWKSMSIHHSQFVWFRKLFVIFSRYAYINTLKEIKQ